MDKEMLARVNRMEAKMDLVTDISDLRSTIKQILEMQILISRMLKMIPDIIINPNKYRDDPLENIGEK